MNKNACEVVFNATKLQRDGILFMVLPGAFVRPVTIFSLL